VAEIKAMTENEFYGWLVYFNQKAELSEKK